MSQKATDSGAPLSEEGASVVRTALELAERGALSLSDVLTVSDRLIALEKRATAFELYRVWLEHTASPLAYVVYFNYATGLAGVEDYAAAEQMNLKALEANPDLIHAHLNLGNNLEQLGRPEESLAHWREALAHPNIRQPENKPLLLHALNNLGRLLESRREFQEALGLLEESIQVDPDQFDVLLHLGHLRQKQCIWPLVLGRSGETLEERAKGSSPLALLAGTDDPQVQLAAARWFVDYKFTSRQTDKVEVSLAPGAYRHPKIRIGYLSSDFCLHAVSLLTVELFELHDREKFEVYGFCWSREDGTELRNRVMGAMDHFIKIGTMSDREAADCIRAHEIDVLVDLQGLTSGARPMILSYRPAPVQMTYLGFPGTTGLPWIDYVIADHYLIPDRYAPFYSEKPLRLPNGFQVSDRKRPVGAMPNRKDNELPENAFVFCSFNNNYKFTEEVFACWMRILAQVPGSVLWLLADNQWSRENLCLSADRHGIDRQRLIFASRVAPPDYLARYQLADLFLDTFPFNGGTTANDALFMGLPLLTLSGRTFASRMAGSLLTQLGLPELITTTLKEYEKKAVALAKKPQRLKELKRRLAERKGRGLPFDSVQFVKEYEAEIARVVPRKGAEAVISEVSRLAGHLQGDYGDPTITILMLAENPAFSAEAIGSVLSQTYRAFRLVVSDNTENASVIGSFRERFTDPRISWVHAWPATGGDRAEQMKFLLPLAKTKYFRFMQDDHILYQTSNAHLISLLEANEHLVGAFHGRHLVNENGMLLWLNHWLPTGGLQPFSERQLAELVFQTVSNLFGEVSFAMYRTAVGGAWSVELDGCRFNALWDTAVGLNLSRTGTVAGSGAILGAYRRSEPHAPVGQGLAGIVESELLCRLLNARYHFSPELVRQALEKIRNSYRTNLPAYPKLDRFLVNLEMNAAAGTLVPDQNFTRLYSEAR